MIRVLVAAAAGSAITSLLFLYLIIPEVRSNWRAQGASEGSVTAQLHLAQQLRLVAANNDARCRSLKPLFSVKSTTVHLAECAGIKTVHVVE